MVDFHRLKNLGTDILGRAGEFAEQAKDKVSPLAEQAKDKVGPLAEQAKDRVVPLAGKAKDAAAKGVDKAAEGLDTATGHRFHDKLGDVTGNREKNPTAASADTSTSGDASTYDSIEDAVIVEDPIADPGSPVDMPATDTPAADAPFADDEPAVVDAVIVDEGPAASPENDPAPELLITTDDGSVHHPTPADMPAHRADDEQV